MNWCQCTKPNSNRSFSITTQSANLGFPSPLLAFQAGCCNCSTHCMHHINKTYKGKHNCSTLLFLHFSPSSSFFLADPAMAISGPSGLVRATAHMPAAAHLFALVSAVLVLVWVIHFRGGLALHSDNKDLIFNIHPVVMCLGFILVAGEAIMAYKLQAERNVQKFLHMAFHFTALTLGIFGVYVAFKYHKESYIPDMVSLHSWLGMCTIILFGLQWFFGFVYFWYPRAHHMTRAMVAPLHAAAGMAIFLMTICTAETGFVQQGTDPGTETRLINFIGLFILLFGVAVCISTAIRRVSL